jgi:hypothetical protein
LSRRRSPPCGQALQPDVDAVGDHTKAIFAKLGVNSRPELTAMLYHDHHLPSLAEAGQNALS